VLQTFVVLSEHTSEAVRAEAISTIADFEAAYQPDARKMAMDAIVARLVDISESVRGSAVNSIDVFLDAIAENALVPAFRDVLDASSSAVPLGLLEQAGGREIAVPMAADGDGRYSALAFHVADRAAPGSRTEIVRLVLGALVRVGERLWRFGNDAGMGGSIAERVTKRPYEDPALAKQRQVQWAVVSNLEITLREHSEKAVRLLRDLRKAFLDNWTEALSVEVEAGIRGDSSILFNRIWAFSVCAEWLTNDEAEAISRLVQLSLPSDDQLVVWMAIRAGKKLVPVLSPEMAQKLEVLMGSAARWKTEVILTELGVLPYGE